LDLNAIFNKNYHPITDHVQRPYPVETVDFSFSGSYSIYNWELFFHIPFLIACRLSNNQKFEDAQKWFHYIFNPTDSSNQTGIKRFWKFLPFHTEKQPDTVQELMEKINSKDSELLRQVEEWMTNPFNPHLIARLRFGAYQKAVVMKYIDTLIAAGDQLFSRNTRESIGEATQLYIMADHILGKRPENISARGSVKRVYTYHSIEQNLDVLSNAIVEQENYFPYTSGNLDPDGDYSEAESISPMFYFCIPKNDKLLKYWDTVQDRLFKIRHCMNIQGIERQLALFEPPIDPGLLVRAFAMGVDIGSILNDMNAPVPNYRFSYMVQKATELCSDLKTLASLLLRAIEMKDAEGLALIRSTHEKEILESIKDIKKSQIEETNHVRIGLNITYASANERASHYEKLLAEQENSAITLLESEYLRFLKESQDWHYKAQSNEESAAEHHNEPSFNINVGLAPAGPAAYGATFSLNTVIPSGFIKGYSDEANAKSKERNASLSNYNATRDSILASYQRRKEDWELQKILATREMNNIDIQKLAADVRKDIAEKELKSHEKQIDNARQTQEWLMEKFNSKDLYDWQVSQISAIYFQSYQMAYDIAKKSEKAFQFETGISDSNFIQFGHWDSIKKGLLAAERLHYDLKRMEVAYLEKNKREYEITKTISLAITDPKALITLKENGVCEFDLTEPLFNQDYPAHYMRKLKMITVTIPCITGPYTNVNCTLILMKNSIRIKNVIKDDLDYTVKDNDNFSIDFGAIESIATSTAQNDAGLFEVNFHDERYLPFEGKGAISRWRLDMPREHNNFDFNTISDVIVNISYTARNGGQLLKAAAEEELKESLKALEKDKGLIRLFSARHEFSSQWHKFLYPSDNNSQIQTLVLDISRGRLPFQYDPKKNIGIKKIDIFLKLREEYLSKLPNPALDINGNPLSVNLISADGQNVQKELKMISNQWAGLPYFSHPFPNGSDTGIWNLEIDRKKIPDWLQQKDENGNPEVTILNNEELFRLNIDAIADIGVVCRMSVE
jgi:hypothetical protein